MLVPQAPIDPPPLAGFIFLAIEPGVDAAVGDRGCGVVTEQRQGVDIRPFLSNLLDSSLLIDWRLHFRTGWMSRHGTLPASGEGVSFKQVPDVGARRSHWGRNSAVPGIVTIGRNHPSRLPRQLQVQAVLLSFGPSRSLGADCVFASNRQRPCCGAFVELGARILQCRPKPSAIGWTASRLKGL